VRPGDSEDKEGQSKEGDGGTMAGPGETQAEVERPLTLSLRTSFRKDHFGCPSASSIYFFALYGALSGQGIVQVVVSSTDCVHLAGCRTLFPATEQR
jgi:hypothetical protein